MSIKRSVICDGPWCGASTPLNGDDLPEGWVEHHGKHFCPATVRLALARLLNIRYTEPAS